MRHLVVCCDGTWNTPDQEDEGIPSPTNVVRLHGALAELDSAGHAQLRYYHPGVGTDGNWWAKVKGGALGDGLDRNIVSAWRWLCWNFQDGDRIWLFGFSRGAYTVRSLGGLMSRCGLPDLGTLPEAQQWALLEQLFKQVYRAQPAPAGWEAGHAFHKRPGEARVDFLGVWDTVGALGVPDNMAVANLLDDRRKFAFHDTTLSPLVLQARHAVALDERRSSFAPTLWTGTELHPGVRQIWFPGVHSDVGGGYAETGLSDGALHWMIEEARGQGLAFREGMAAQVRPDFQGILHDSCGGVYKRLRSQPRSAPQLCDANRGGRLHDSVLSRLANPPISQPHFHRQTSLAPEGTQVEVFATERWNETGLWLEGGVRYEFSAAGQWVDGSASCGPEGRGGGTTLGYVLSGLQGRLETLFRKASHNDKADFAGTRRVENAPWMALIGVVASGGNPTADGTPAPHETFPIGKGAVHAPRSSGYLYCFANDAWGFYKKNKGAVRLTVKRLSA